MSASKESRFHPQNPNWYEDLVLRSSSYEDKHFTGACFNEDVSVVDENYLEISRESSFMRGSGVLLAVILIFIFSGNVVPAIFRPGFAFFSYMPYLLPGPTGRRYRQMMRWYDYLLAFISVWFFWIWLPLGICHYVAVTCAPEPKWPAEIDAESRSLRLT